MIDINIKLLCAYVHEMLACLPLLLSCLSFLSNASSSVITVPVILAITAIPSTGVSQGMPLNLTCEAVGEPTLGVTWTTPTGPRMGPVISVDSVTADDAGEYRCEVIPESSAANSSITISGERVTEGNWGNSSLRMVQRRLSDMLIIGLKVWSWKIYSTLDLT